MLSIPFSKSTTSFHVPPSTSLPTKTYRNQNPPTVLTTSKSGHTLDQDFVDLKERIKTIVNCFDDIKKIAPEDVAAIFQLRGWPIEFALREQADKFKGNWTDGASPEANLTKLTNFCELEHVPDCVPSNALNAPLVNYLLLGRLHRRVLATNEGSGSKGPTDYKGLARFACEYRYIQGATNDLFYA